MAGTEQAEDVFEHYHHQGEGAFACAIKDIVAGSARGIAQVVSGHPLDTIKVRLQTQPLLSSTAAAAAATAAAESTHSIALKYGGPFDCIAKTFAEEGVFGFYKGAASPLLGCSLYSAILFLAYGQSKRFFDMDKASIRPSSGRNDLMLKEWLQVGATTGGAAAFIEGPIDVAKSKMQVQYQLDAAHGADRVTFTRYKNTFECVRDLIRVNGIRGPYQGFSATLARNIPGSAVYFPSYEVMRNYMSPNDPDAHWAVLTAGGLSGMLFWLSIYPVDVIKSHLMTDATARDKRKYRGVLDCTRRVYAAGGMQALWRGFIPCMVRAFPVNAVTFFAYEKTRALLG